MSDNTCTHCSGLATICDGCGKPRGTCGCVDPAWLACIYCEGTGQKLDFAEMTQGDLANYALWLQVRAEYLFQVNTQALFALSQSEILLAAEKDSHMAALLGAKKVAETLAGVVQNQRVQLQNALNDKKPE